MAQFLEFTLQNSSHACLVSYSARFSGVQRFWPLKAVRLEKAAATAASRAGCVESKRCSHLSEHHEKRACVRVEGGIKYGNISVDESRD